MKRQCFIVWCVGALSLGAVELPCDPASRREIESIRRQFQKSPILPPTASSAEIARELLLIRLQLEKMNRTHFGQSLSAVGGRASGIAKQRNKGLTLGVLGESHPLK